MHPGRNTICQLVHTVITTTAERSVSIGFYSLGLVHIAAYDGENVQQASYKLTGTRTKESAESTICCALDRAPNIRTAFG